MERNTCGIEAVVHGSEATENPRSWHEALDQEGGVEVWVHAPAWAELVKETGRALGEQLILGAPASATGPTRDLSVRAPGRPALLAAWVNQILYRAEAEWWVPTEIAVLAASDSGIEAQARGISLDGPTPPWRELSPREASIRTRPGGLEAEFRLVG